MPRPGLKCLNTNFICYATHPPWRGGGGVGWIVYSELDFFFFDDLTSKLLQAFPPKASVENSSAQWAIF